MERDKVDKAAVGFDYKSQTEKHDSQKGEPQQPGELEGLEVLEEVRELGEPAEGENRQCQGWSWGLCPLVLWDMVQGICSLLQEWWKSYRELLGMGQVRKGIVQYMAAEKSSG